MCVQFHGFQAARAGLKKHAPQLATSGTGGSYFIADVQVGALQCMGLSSLVLNTSAWAWSVNRSWRAMWQDSLASPHAVHPHLQALHVHYCRASPLRCSSRAMRSPSRQTIQSCTARPRAPPRRACGAECSRARAPCARCAGGLPLLVMGTVLHLFLQSTCRS